MSISIERWSGFRIAREYCIQGGDAFSMYRGVACSTCHITFGRLIKDVYLQVESSYQSCRCRMGSNDELEAFFLCWLCW